MAKIKPVTMESETFKQIKEMGYDGVELAGTYGKSVSEIKAMLDEVGLELVRNGILILTAFI